MTKRTPEERSALRAMRKSVNKRNDNLSGGARWRNLDLLISFLTVVVIALAVRGAVAEPVRVDGNSMNDTLANNDLMFVEKLTYAVSDPQVGDVVICYYPDEYYENANLSYKSRVKRVVAVAGDTIWTEGGYLYVNGEKQDEPFLSDARRSTGRIEEPIVVPEGTVYVMGDNRINSNDSRLNAVGPIPVNKIVGKALFVIYPFTHIRGL